MGFYGNITNTTRTQFSFDAVYNNRYAMDTLGSSDHVYVGRYVLVEYDTENGSLDQYPPCYKVADSNLVSGFVFCISPELILPDETNNNPGTVIQLGTQLSVGEDGAVEVEKGTVIRIPGTRDGEDNLYNQYTNDKASIATEFWVCTGETTAYIRVPSVVNGQVTYSKTPFKTASWESIGTSNSTSFMLNYNQDKIYYGVSRGYDSTVWQKVLQNGYEKYVMVAELNTVVPTFDLAADAPTQVPLIPHFDVNSTNVYYKLHWQPNWGFRVRTANMLQTPQMGVDGTINDSSTISTSNDAIQYPSDETIVWERNYYDKTTNDNLVTYARATDGKITWVEKNYSTGSKPELPAAIYYNRDGLSPEKVVKSWDNTYENQSELNTAPRRNPSVDPSVDLANGKKNFVIDEITLKPTGLSGQKYQTHAGNESVAADTQELSIMLPSIGDAISDIWDLIYGGRATNEAIQKTQKRNMDIEWYDARAVQDRAGLRMVKDGFTYTSDEDATGDLFQCKQDYYNKANVNTLAGCINSVHDLMGMIIQPYETIDQLATDGAANTTDIILYSKNDKKYYRKGNRYEYTPIEVTWIYEEVSLSQGEYRPDLYYILKNKEYVVATGDYDEDAIYYARKLPADKNWQKVSLTDFNGNYYYKNSIASTGKFDYILEDEYHRDKTYYSVNTSTIDKTREDLGDEFTIGKYYLYSKDSDGVDIFTLDKKEYQDSAAYYDIEEIFSLDDVENDTKYVDLYLPGIFYYKAWSRNDYEEFQWDNSIKDTLYTKDEDGNYIEFTETPTKDDWYYRIKHYEGEPYGEDTPNKDDFEYRIDNTPLGTGHEKYTNLVAHYMVEAQDSQVEIYTPVDFYAPVFFDNNSGYIYAANTYYVYNGTDYVISADASPQPDTQYYEKQTKYIFTSSGGTINENNPLNLLPYNSTKINYVDKNGKSQVFNVDANHPWYLKDLVTTYDDNGNAIYNITYTEVTPTSMRDRLISYYVNKNSSKGTLEYFKINKTKISSFYIPNRYYYKVGQEKDIQYQGSYILETNAKKVIENSSDDSYALAHLTIDDNLFKKVNKTFYIPNYYYYTLPSDTTDYIFATEDSMVDGATYYIDAQYYVVEDTSGILPYGQKWNGNIKYVPPSITLAERTLVYDYYELKDFARKLNTIHGMILKMNQLIDEENTGSRDLDTIQGVLNNLNDWISKLGTFDSQELVMVDNYGRLQSANVDTTSQIVDEDPRKPKKTKTDATDIVSDIFPLVDSCTDKDWKNQWLTINIDGKPTNPKITFRHNYQPVSNTTSSYNVNGNGSKITVETPIVDPRGHVVGSDTKTITLPYSFKTIKTNGRNDDDSTENASSTPITDNVIADSAQDTLTINSGNKWIRLDTDSSSDTLTISHDIHNITTTKKTDTNLNSSSTDTMTIQDISFDAAGHVVANQQHTYTLPYGFKTIKTNGRASNDNTTELGSQSNVVADNTQDTLTINSGNEWVKITTDSTSDILTISHDVKKTTSTTSTQSLISESNTMTFDVPTYNFDATNHFISKDIKTFTLPNSYGKIAGDAGSATEASASHDTFTLSGDSWLKTTVSADKVTFTHEAPLKTDNTTTYSTNGTPTLGASFSLPTVSYDSKGHISSNGTYTITLPSLELTGSKATGDNVLVDLTYTKNGTTFTKTYGKIGDLALTGYTLPTEDSGAVLATDSLNSAVGKLQYSINQEISNRKDAITELKFEDTAVDGQYVSAVNESNGIISVERAKFVKADTGNFGITKLFDDYDNEELFDEEEENSIDLEGLAASATALRKLYQNTYNESSTFDYQVATKVTNELGEIDVTTEIQSLTITDIISRIEALEKLIVKESTSIEVDKGLIEEEIKEDETEPEF